MFNPTDHTDIIKKLPSILYKPLAQAWVDYEFPRHIFIETTSACQLSCEYCPREKRNEHMDWELFTSIVDECSEYGPRSFSLHLFGEVLLYPKIVEAIDYIKDKNKNHKVLLTTNGVLLNKFNKSLDRVDRIIWTYRKNNFNEESIKLLRRKGLIRLLIEETPKEEFERWSRFPRVEIKHLHNYGGNIDVQKWGLKSFNETEFRYPCYHLWLAPAIRWNGDITICCNDPLGKERIGSYSSSFTIHDFWTSVRLSEIRSSHLENKPMGICVGCNSYKAYPDMFFEIQKKHGHLAPNPI